MNKRHARMRKGNSSRWLELSAITRIGICVVVGVLMSLAVGIFISWEYAPLAFWDVTAFILLASLLISLLPLTAEQTATHATNEDPGRGAADIILILSSIASLVAVVVLMVQSNQATGAAQYLEIALGIVSIVISWAVVHTVYMLRYAHLYFKDKKAIDFNTNEPPSYIDFAYVAFTIGMTYQVSDTSLKTTELRRAALSHALLSYIFGTAIIAATINFVVGLAK